MLVLNSPVTGASDSCIIHVFEETGAEPRAATVTKTNTYTGDSHAGKQASAHNYSGH